MRNYILGIWDGHDAGAALVAGESIPFAVNEERLTRRKLEAGFPLLSIKACLAYAGIAPSDITEIAASTADTAKTLTRIFPSLKEEYYLIRRRKKGPGRFDGLKKRFKYRFTEYGPNSISRYLSRLYFDKKLSEMGFCNYNLHLPDHHLCHANTAARCSGFDECLVITLDGLGDGLSGSVWIYRNGRLRPVNKIPAKVSMGVFFEHVTNLLNMRELEDEGKVMALANYAFPVDDSANPLLIMIKCDGLSFVSGYSSTGMFKEMKKIFWRYPPEQFACMAQRTVEKITAELVQNAVAQTGMKRLALAGGLFSNIKLNKRLGELPEVEKVSVFPHMGDGGLAIGAALEANYHKSGISNCGLSDLYLGPGYSEKEILDCLIREKASFEKISNPAKKAADLILNNEIILWFQGRMEAGPRALGNRSILARADDRRLKDRLNLALKKRVWYQPFCPSMLAEDAKELLCTEKLGTDNNPYMTMAYSVRHDRIKAMEGVVNLDGTCRPHFVGDENPRYRELLGHIKMKTGYGVVLNTSFNIHGDPVVCSPGDALDTFYRTDARYLFMEDFLVENKTR
ncbi:MAG: hypothetical protein EHM85_02280 [Desulfobacteraceae bacterium]|nr:MAG: hypothetical protein EHM85_02280 [Desulfobacteraceae bacterium]